MKFSNVRLLVKDFAKCFKFYSEQLGLEPAWGDENSGESVIEWLLHGRFHPLS